MHQRTWETPKSREFRENKLRTNQPTQAMFTVLEIIIPGVKVQVFETEIFPLLPLTEAALWVGRANATKPPLEYFLPEFQQIFESSHLEILQITTSLPTASTKLNEHLTHDLKNAPLWLFLNETSILEWGGVWNSLRYFQSPWNRSEIISQHISSISFLSMRQPVSSDHFSLMDWGSALEKGPDQFRSKDFVFCIKQCFVQLRTSLLMTQIPLSLLYGVSFAITSMPRSFDIIRTHRVVNVTPRELSWSRYQRTYCHTSHNCHISFLLLTFVTKTL